MSARPPLTTDEADAIVARVCGSKHRFGRAEARRVSGRMRRQGHVVSPYRCPFCSRWHVGHVPSMESIARIAQVIRARAYPPKEQP